MTSAPGSHRTWWVRTANAQGPPSWGGPDAPSASALALPRVSPTRVEETKKRSLRRARGVN